jgi:hypothetical protein
LWGCFPAPPEAPGGLKAEDFKLISLNGFDPVDNAADKNDYAWSMEYFQPDGSDQGYVYVGTGNDMKGGMTEGLKSFLNDATLFAAPRAYPPEIRRYRPDIFRVAWETVFDIRQVEIEPNFTTMGFRYMKAYRARSDGINYLYAATMGREANVWRSKTGDPNSWSRVWTAADAGAVRWMEVHNGDLYLALTNDSLQGEHVGKIWATDGAQFWPVIEDGFGNPENEGVQSLVSYNGWLYAGTSNLKAGFEIWKLAGPDANEGPIRIVANGGPSAKNQWACSPCVFQGKLYWGALLTFMTAMMELFPGGDMIRIDPNDQWETVVGAGSVAGISSGFGDRFNTYIWSLAVHDGWLYAGTFDQLGTLRDIPAQMLEFIKAFLMRGRTAGPIELLGHAGADLYKTQDGLTWYPVTLDGFGNVGNYGFRTLMSVGQDLYVGTANPSDGLEVWKATSTGD